MMERCSAVLILFLLSPVWTGIAILIVIEGVFSPRARGRVLFWEERISQGRPFRMAKFRTFYPAALAAGGDEKTRRFGLTAIEGTKTNLTRTGRLIKKIYLDELPQLINVAMGQMRFVGPRPLVRPLYERHLRHGNKAKTALKAGWTGPWQSRKSRLLTFDDMVKLENDYARDIEGLGRLGRFVYDVKVIGLTFRVIFQAKGI